VCPEGDPGEKYCQNPQWDLRGETEAKTSPSGDSFYEFVFADPTPQSGWKIEWSDPNVKIKQILVSGVLTFSRKPVTPVSYCQLAAYPRNAVPKYTENSQGEKVPLYYCNLAYVDINSKYEVEKIVDARQTVNSRYQPVADWLTKPWDDNLGDLQTQVNNFPKYWMSPGSSAKFLYGRLDSKVINLEQ
jgi:hypothetical protein